LGNGIANRFISALPLAEHGRQHDTPMFQRFSVPRKGAASRRVIMMKKGAFYLKDVKTLSLHFCHNPL
jgi:hypothetical protein